MTDWLSEIENIIGWAKDREAAHLAPFKFDIAKAERMARVLRELGGVIRIWFLDLTEQQDWFDYLSDDAKELCVAASKNSNV